MTLKLNKNYKRVICFGLIGVINTIVDLASFSFLFYTLDANLILAHGCGFLLAIASSYTLNTRYTFKDRIQPQKSGGNFSSFFAVSFITLLVSSMTLLMLSLYINEFIAKLLTTLVSFLFNYLMLNKWLYKG